MLINIFVALDTKHFKDSIKFKNLKFNDEYFTLKSEFISTSDGINFFVYNALTDVNDVKSNNFSNIFLTKKQKNSNILEVSEIDKKSLLDVVTTLSFFSNDANNELNPGVWLAADKSYYTYDINTSASSFRLTEGAPDNRINYLFRLECISETECTISHSFGDNRYYLAYDEGFKCITDGSKDFTKFIYHIDGQQLRLYFKLGENLFSIRCKEGPEGFALVLADKDIDDSSTILYINTVQEEFIHNIDASWGRYERNDAISAIDPYRSSISEESQFIIHHQYNDDEDSVNFIPLKNNLTYQGTVTNGSNLTLSSNNKLIGTPIVDFRNYSNINSGCNQELGTENITLTFTFTDQVLRLKEGDRCYFTIPDIDEATGFPALYPYEKLNINDSSFVRNGAFGSDAPFFADTFSKFMNEKSSVNNYSYLCTWLYQPNNSTAPVWLDRYYYPDIVNRAEALGKPTDEQNVLKFSFENILDKYYLRENFEDIENLSQYQISELKKFKDTLQKQGYIDKKSDLYLQGGTKYQYNRISNDTVENIFNKLASDKVSPIKDQSGNNVNLDFPIAFNGNQWRQIPAESFGKTSSFNFNTNLYINPSKKIGIQLFGSDYKHGFNIQNRKDLCPFTYYADKAAIYLLNNSFEIVNKFNLQEKYNVEVKYAVIGEPFDDVYIFTDKSLFIFDYDLRLKNRMEITTIIENGGNGIVQNIKSEDISASYIIQHKRNLFAVINNSSILKIIFKPESELESNLCQNGPSCRLLSKDEYITNFNMVVDPSKPQTAHIIKSIYAMNDKIYAFNYDLIKMSYDGDTLYGLLEDKKPLAEPWYYIFHQTLSRLYTTAAASKYAEFTSDKSIDNLAFGSNGTFALIRGFKSDSESCCLEVYDKSKTKIYNYSLDDFDKIISFDFYRYIDNEHAEHDAFVALGIVGGFLNAIEYRIDEERVLSHRINLKYDGISTFRNIIDSNTFITKLNENKIYFNLFLDDNVSSISHEWDLKEAQQGWYNINVEVDMDEARFEIKINDATIGKYNNTTHPLFRPHTHTNTTIFGYNYYFGIIGKRYGTTLGEILKAPSSKEPYAITNIKCENTTLYKKTLNYHEYQANRLHFSKINDLALTIPCGIRNGIEEIIRYFKYNKPASISNSIKINISGVDGIKNESEFNRLKSNILMALSDNDCLTTINEIEFI